MNNNNNNSKIDKSVYTVIERGGRSLWVRIGTATTDPDGSITVHLDALPVNGTIKIINR